MFKWIADNKIPILCIILTLGVVIGVYSYFSSKHDQAVLMTQEQIQKADELQKQLSISEGNARKLQEAIEKANSKPAYITYNVQAPTVEKAAVIEQERIKQGTSIANQIPADRTIVTPNIQEQKVDVYRINLDKAKWGINVIVLAGGGQRAEVGAGPSWKNRDNAINAGITTEKRGYFMWTFYR